MAARIPDDLIHKYEPGNHGEFQCKYFRNKCRNENCLYKFKANEILCPKCNTPRVRCGAKAAPDTEACRSHTHRGVLSIWTLSSGRISEEAIAEVIESDTRSVDVEMAVARLLLSNIVEDNSKSDTQKLRAIKEFLDIQLQRKKLETGDDLEIKLDDKTAEAIRRRFKFLINAFQGALKEFVPDEEKVKQIMERVKLASKLAGRHTVVGQGLPKASVPAVRLDI